jgi:Ca2+-binding EF-hand superfamily protein
MRLHIMIAAVASFAAMSGTQAEQNPKTAQDVERVFESLDRNDDERISRRESARGEVLRDRFKGVDADQDGYVSRAEYRARPRNEQFE